MPSCPALPDPDSPSTERASPQRKANRDDLPAIISLVGALAPGFGADQRARVRD
jgi:hypothetical protein